MSEHEHVHEHGHEHPHVHGHVHDPEQTKKISNRLARAIGHLESIKKMVEDDRDCSEVLIQLAAIYAAHPPRGGSPQPLDQPPDFAQPHGYLRHRRHPAK